MSLLFAEKRSAKAHPLPNDYNWGFSVVPQRLMPGGHTAEQALQLVPLFAAHRLIADQFSSCPMQAYRVAPDGSKHLMPKQPSLLTMPSASRSSTTWKQQMIASLLAHGNAFGMITALDASGWPATIEWLSPADCAIDETKALPRYFWRGKQIDSDSFVHIPWHVQPGRWRGLSPLQAFQSALETGSQAQETAKNWFANGATPSGHMKNTAKTMTAPEASAAKSRFRAAVAGRDVLVTGNDWDFTPIGVTADQVQFIDQLKLTATQIASIYGIPPEMIGGETGSSMTYKTVEQNLMNLATLTMRPWFERVEDHLTALLPRPQYVKFNIDAMIRADIKTRMESHQIALDTGIETLNEARDIEDKPPLTDQEKAEFLARTAQAPMPPDGGGLP